MISKQIKNYRLTAEIGKGSFGIVYEAIDVRTNILYAIKTIQNKELEKASRMESLKREYTNLRKISNKHIIQLQGLEKTANNTYIVLEYCNGGTLGKYLNFYKKLKNSPLSEAEIQYIVRQLIQGLEYMHLHNYIHRDLKLENIFLNFDEIPNIYNGENQLSPESKYSKFHSIFNCSVKIGDFGLSKSLDEINFTSTFCGTAITMAPEVVSLKIKNKTTKYDKVADIWSLGAIIYELAFGGSPFLKDKNIDINGLFNKIINGEYSFPKNRKISSEIISLIRGLLHIDPEKRLNWDQINSHPFIKKNTDEFTFVEPEKIDDINLEIKEKIFNLSLDPLINENHAEKISILAKDALENSNEKKEESKLENLQENDGKNNGEIEIEKLSLKKDDQKLSIDEKTNKLIESLSKNIENDEIENWEIVSSSSMNEDDFTRVVYVENFGIIEEHFK